MLGRDSKTDTDFLSVFDKTIYSFSPICNSKLWKLLIEIVKNGKKLRPDLIILLWKNFYPQLSVPKKLINDLVALELIHASTLIHDDIIDKGLFRRNIPTINNKYGNEIALLMGNIVKDLAINVSTPRSISSLNGASFDVNLGQMWETLARKHKTISINHYFSIVFFKTSKIFIHSLDIFSAFSKTTLTETEKNHFVAMAIVYQITDDIIDHLNPIQNDKSIGQDKHNNVHSFVYSSFNEEFYYLAENDGVFYQKEILFIRECIDILRNSYKFKSKFEELPSNRQIDFVKDLCNLLMTEAENQRINNCVNQVLKVYYQKIISSILKLKLQ